MKSKIGFFQDYCRVKPNYSIAMGTKFFNFKRLFKIREIAIVRQFRYKIFLCFKI